MDYPACVETHAPFSHRVFLLSYYDDEARRKSVTDWAKSIQLIKRESQIPVSCSPEQACHSLSPDGIVRTRKRLVYFSLPNTRKSDRMPSRSHRLVLLIGLLLTIIAISRVARIRTYALDVDEEYTLWATVGTAQQIIVWTPSSETSTHYLLFAAWQRLFGMEPMLIRFLVALLSLPASAIMYRAVRRMHGETAGIMTMLVYAAVGFNMFLTLYARGYFISVVAVPLAFWLTVRYFAKPTFRRALPLALSLFAMYAGQVTTVPTFGIIGLYTLLVYGRRIWLWWLPGLLALIPAAFEIIASGKLRLVGQRTSVGLPPVGFYLPDAVWRFFSYFVGVGLVPLIWLGLVVLAFVLLLRSRTRIAWLWAALTITIPIALYYLETRLGFYEFKRYAWWYIVPLTLWIGIALAHLPPRWIRVAAALLIALMLLPYPINPTAIS